MSMLQNRTPVIQKTPDKIDQAVNSLAKYLAADQSYEDLSKRLRVFNEKTPSESGLNDHDYPNIFGSSDVMSEVSLVKRVPLPNELIEHFARMQCNCIMGLYPEIKRAWLTIDNDVFVWNYENGGDLAYFDGLNETVLTCGLVKPVKGIFQPHISHLLLLATPVDIVILGVTFVDPRSESVGSDPSMSEMHLLPEPLFSLQTDNTTFLCVCGTESGRIFMGARDGCLYEIVYQAEDSWFSKRCRKINLTNSSLFSFISFTPSFLRKELEAIVQLSVDEGRHILYTRSDKGSIQVIDLGNSGQDVSRVAELSSKQITNTAAQIVKTVDKVNFEDIVHISAVKKDESFHINLVAVTSRGVRLYFTVKPFTQLPERPVQLTLVHVRLPPGFSNTTETQRPSRVHIAHHSHGNTMMISSQSDDVSLLWTISSDSFPFRHELSEMQMTTQMGGHTWALSEELGTDCSWSTEPYMNSSKPFPPTVCTQHMNQPRQYVVLSAQGSSILKKLRPVDQLRNLLVKYRTYDSPDIETFFKIHGTIQACATCLIIASSRLPIDAEVSELATAAFFKFGGDPSMTRPADQTVTVGQYQQLDVTAFNPGFHPGQISTPMIGRIPASATQSHPVLPEVIYSGKHEGVYLYLSRILAPLWNSKLVTEVKTGSNVALVSRVSIEDLSWFLELLDGLRIFLVKNSSYLTTSGGLGDTNYAHLDEQRSKNQEAIQREKNSLMQLLSLVERSIEVLNLWKILCEHQFHVISSKLESNQQNELKTATLETLLLTNTEQLFSNVIERLVSLYVQDKSSVDAISDKLRKLCPNLYSLDDAKCSKATEILQSLKIDPHSYNRAERLEQAMNLYKEVSPNLSLQHVVEMLALVRHYDGILDICLITASRHDPQNHALHYYNTGDSYEPARLMFDVRMDCYKYIFESLKFLLMTSSSSVNSASIPNKPGASVLTNTDTLTSQEAERFAESLYSKAVKSNDELFHVNLYDWLIENQLTDKLLQIRSPYLESYLTHRSKSVLPAQSEIQTADLLWRFHERTKNFTAAAKILYDLADKPSAEVDLRRRIEYLSRAVITAKSNTSRLDRMNGQYLHELEDKLDVATVQLSVLENLTNIKSAGPDVQRAVGQLNSQLFDLTTLYGDFAEVFDLSECKLTILKCGGHYDSVLIDMLWSSLIQQEFERHNTTADVSSKMALIQTKIVNLARKFENDDKFLPLNLILKCLELFSLRESFTSSWAVSTLKQSGVSNYKLLVAYDQLYKSKDPCWKNAGRPFHLLVSISGLLEKSLQLNNLTSSERSKTISYAQDAISSYLVEVQSSTFNQTEAERLAMKFREIKQRIQRL